MRVPLGHSSTLVHVLWAALCVSTAAGQAPPASAPVAAELPLSGRLIPKGWTAGCGVDALYLGLQLIGIDVDYFDLADRVNTSQSDQRASLNTLWQVARAVGAHAVAIETSEEDLLTVLSQTPGRAAILHLKASESHGEHLVAAYYSQSKEIALAGRGKDAIDDAWRSRWSGIALVLSTKPMIQVPTTGPVPRIEFDSVDYSAGRQPNGGSFNYAFAIRNTGGTLLNLKKAFASCACAGARFLADQVPPGQSTQLVGVIETGTRPENRFAKVTILCDDPERPRTDVVVTWEVAPPAIVFKPSELSLSPLLCGETHTASVAMEFADDGQVHVNEVSSPERWIHPVLAPDGRHVIVQVAPDWGDGERVGEVVVKTRGREVSFKLPVRVVVVPPVRLLPSRLFWDRTPRQAETVIELVIRPSRDGDALEFLGAELMGLPGSVARERDPNRPKEWTLSVKLGPCGQRPPFFVGTLRLRIGRGETQSSLDVPVCIRTSDGAASSSPTSAASR